MAAGAGPSPAPVPQRQQAPYKRKWERSSVIRQGHSGNSNIFWAPPRGPHHEGPTRPGSYTHLTYNSRPGGGLYAHPGDGTKNYRQREKKRSQSAAQPPRQGQHHFYMPQRAGSSSVPLAVPLFLKLGERLLPRHSARWKAFGSCYFSRTM